MPTVRQEWGMACPDCGRDDHLRIEMTTWGALLPDGTDPDACHEWDRRSSAECQSCGWTGQVRDLDLEAEEKAQ